MAHFSRIMSGKVGPKSSLWELSQHYFLEWTSFFSLN